jgi:hypothetical protein
VPDPVSVKASWVGGYSAADLRRGTAVLAIVTGDGSDADERVYWAKGVVRKGGKFQGVELRQFATARTYFVRFSGSGFVDCSCGDRVHRPNRPGGCKHMAALNQLRR